MNIAQRQKISIPAPLFRIGDVVTWMSLGQPVSGRIFCCTFTQEITCHYWQYGVVYQSGELKGHDDFVFEKQITDYWNREFTHQ